MTTLLKTGIQLFAVAAAYATIGVLLYRERVTADIWLFESDVFVFYLPAITAMIVNAWIIAKSLPPAFGQWLKSAVVFALAALATLAGTWLYATIAFNNYGS